VMYLDAPVCRSPISRSPDVRYHTRRPSTGQANLPPGRDDTIVAGPLITIALADVRLLRQDPTRPGTAR
jgi:hypothetical protein